MTCPADLHTHTTASDGQYTPSQLAAKALAAGIQILAVTDHDTMDGAEEAVRAGQACGLTVLLALIHIYTGGPNVVGVDLPFDEPQSPDLVLQNDGERTPLELVEEIEGALYPNIVEHPIDLSLIHI